MKKIKTFSAFFILLLLFYLSPAVFAGRIDEPKVEYSADSLIETEGGVFKGRVFHAPGKERREQASGGVKQIIITRLDKKVVWVLMPGQKTYMETAITDEKGTQGTWQDPSQFDYEMTTLGQETVNGVKAVKNRITATSRQGVEYIGFMWVTKEGILVRMESAVKDKSSTRIKMDLKNIKIGVQSPSLFEVPAGYSKMGLGGMFDMKDMQDMMKGTD